MFVRIYLTKMRIRRFDPDPLPRSLGKTPHQINWKYWSDLAWLKNWNNHNAIDRRPTMINPNEPGLLYRIHVSSGVWTLAPQWTLNCWYIYIFWGLQWQQVQKSTETRWIVACSAIEKQWSRDRRSSEEEVSSTKNPATTEGRGYDNLLLSSGLIYPVLRHPKQIIWIP